MGTTLLLIRHGHSRGQEQRLTDGHETCQGLSDRGWSEVAALTARLKQRPDVAEVDAIYVSRLRRARETAESVAPVFPNAVLHEDCDLCEIHEPALDGKPHRSRAYFWNTGGFREPSSSGAESYESFYKRACGALTRIVAQHPNQTVLVVTHAGVIRAAMATFAKSPLGEGFFLTMRNTSINEFVYDPTAFRPFEWSLERYNDAAHLDRRSL